VEAHETVDRVDRLARSSPWPAASPSA